MSGEPAPLELPDLQELHRLLSLAASRGAFDLEEYEDVGRIARRLGGFVRGHGAAPVKSAGGGGGGVSTAGVATGRA